MHEKLKDFNLKLTYFLKSRFDFCKNSEIRDHDVRKLLILMPYGTQGIGGHFLFFAGSLGHKD